jgi:phosphatidylglycerol:prolipoprotein diacylglycerol transferase
MSAPFVVDFDPVALHIGPVALHWYGLMYLLSFFGVWYLGERRRRAGRLPVSRDAFIDLAYYAMIGVIVGGRIGYMLFYQPLEWIWTAPLDLFKVWDGGMSFHGGLLGVLVAGLVWSRRRHLHFFDTVDFLAPMVPLGLFLGRFGNFINGELWGKPASVPWAMVFPGAHAEDVQYATTHPALLQVLEQYGGLPRHPSQLYEALLEGLVMFAVLYGWSRRPRPRYAVSGLFALLYGCFRFAIEFVRLPDAQLGYLAWGWLTMGQVLSLPLIAVGLFLLWLSRRAPTLPVAPSAP